MIKVVKHGIEEFQEFIKSVPRGFKIAAMRAISTYLIGNKDRGLKHEPTWKFVSRASAYGKVSDAPEGYFSWAQFRYVAAITEGFTLIPYDRTHEMANAWTMKETNSDWRSVKIENEAEGAEYVYGEQQAAQPGLVGWRKALTIIKSNMIGALKAGNAAVAAWIKQKG